MAGAGARAVAGAGAGAWRVRRAEPGDVGAIDAMVRELALHEREPDAVTATPEDLRAALFGPQPRVHAHVAEVTAEGSPDGPDGWEVVGTAVWFVSFSTWTGRHGTWLEDLYVTPAHRGRGLGRALLAALAAEAVGSGHSRLEWSVLDWNTPAHAVYAAVGARPMEEWTTWRLAGDGLRRLAGRVDARAGADHHGGGHPPGSPTGSGESTMDGSAAVTAL